MTKQLYVVPAAAMGYLTAKLAKLNKKATKAGTSEIKLVRVGRKMDDKGEQHIIVAVEGETVKFGGYTFLARLDHNLDPTGESNIVYPMPGSTLTEEQRLLAANCDHCGWRRNRKDTFILRKDDDGSVIQVGRTCLKDFFGHDPAEVVRRAQFITTVIDSLGGWDDKDHAYMTDRRLIDLETYLSFVAMCIADIGWVSAKEAYHDSIKVATKEVALNIMFSTYRHKDEIPTLEHCETASKAMAYAVTLDATKSDFNFNLSQMAKLEVIDWKAAGMAAAMIFSYTRHLEFEAKKALSPKQELSNSEYVGAEKDRLTLDVTVLSSREHEGDFGLYSITRMLDASGNLFVSFGAYHAKPGDKVAVRGTVKRHQVYNDVKQTVLSRVMAA